MAFHKVKIAVIRKEFALTELNSDAFGNGTDVLDCISVNDILFYHK